jgi:hypothetical protein
VGSESIGRRGRRRRRRRRGRLGRRRIVYIYIEEMRRVGGRGDIRKPDSWYDERGEGMRRQRGDGQVAGDCSSALEKKKETVADDCAHVAVRNVATHNTEETG